MGSVNDEALKRAECLRMAIGVYGPYNPELMTLIVAAEEFYEYIENGMEVT